VYEATIESDDVGEEKSIIMMTVAAEGSPKMPDLKTGESQVPLQYLQTKLLNSLARRLQERQRQSPSSTFQC
jgi:hypothetical protein